MENIGFIGLGIMGESMCENIIRKSGYEVHVFDINENQVSKLTALGGIPEKSIQDIGTRCSIIIIMVPTGKHARSVVEGLLAAVRPGTLIIDMSTIEPWISKELAARVKEKDCSMLDAPVVKSKPAAIKGELGIYAGGSLEDFERGKPILGCMGNNIIHMGDNGAGLVMKICHNMLVGQIQNGVNEMLTMAQAAELNFDNVVAAVSYGGGQNFYLDSKNQNIKNGDFSTKFSVENMNKDINIAVELAEEYNLELSGTENVRKVYAKAMETGLAREDFSATYKVVNKFSRKHI